jgi:hypothetical protein
MASVVLNDLDEQAFVVDVDPNEAMEVWQAARHAVKVTGRWPVLTIEPGILLVSFDGLRTDGPTTSAQRWICDRAQDTNTDALVKARAYVVEVRQSDQWVEIELSQTRRYFQSAPTVDDVKAALGSNPTRRVLDRWLFEWERSTGIEPDVDTGHLTPGINANRLVLLPTAVPWEIPAYMPFFGTAHEGGAEHLIAMLRRWNEMYEAELVAHHGTVLEFVVGRPPDALEVAWALAWEQELVATCTTGLAGVAVRHHARALRGRYAWFLHDRP